MALISSISETKSEQRYRELLKSPPIIRNFIATRDPLSVGWPLAYSSSGLIDQAMGNISEAERGLAHVYLRMSPSLRFIDSARVDLILSEADIVFKGGNFMKREGAIELLDERENGEA